jgi:hypothetical protein
MPVYIELETSSNNTDPNINPNYNEHRLRPNIHCPFSDPARYPDCRLAAGIRTFAGGAIAGC